MEPLTNRIQDHIASLTYEQIKENIQRIPNSEIVLNESFESIYRKGLADYITEGYSTYVTELGNIYLSTVELINSESELIPESFNVNSPQSEVASAYQIYRNLKFFKSDDILSFFKSRGIRDIYLTHFITIKQVEGTMMEIIKSGIMINLKQTMLIIDLIYDVRIFKELYINFIDYQIVDTYDGRKNVKQLDIDLLNIRRQIKSKSNMPNKESVFAGKMKDLYDKAKKELGDEKTAINLLFKTQLNAIRGNNSPCKNILMDYFKPLVGTYSIDRIRTTFKPFFHLLFENTYEGLLTEEEFQKHIDKSENHEKYDGVYSRYYVTRLETLVGL